MNDPNTRRLAAALEPVVGSVYFAPECHERYAAMGFAPSDRRAGQVQLPDGPAYFTSRGSLLGQVPGEVVAAAFGVFNPKTVLPCVAFGWTCTDASTIRRARTEGAVAQLHRLLPHEPDLWAKTAAVLAAGVAVAQPGGRALFAGVTAQESSDDPLTELFRLGDALREYRGDSHNAAWIAAGLDAIEIGLLTELYWGLPMHTYVRTRGWTDEEVGNAMNNLQQRGLTQDGTFTEAGRALREGIEQATDLQMTHVMNAMGSDLDEVLRHLERWGTIVRAGHGYLAAGPHDLAAKAT